jgi:hypothetical protein
LSKDFLTRTTEKEWLLPRHSVSILPNTPPPPTSCINLIFLKFWVPVFFLCVVLLFACCSSSLVARWAPTNTSGYASIQVGQGISSFDTTQTGSIEG